MPSVNISSIMNKVQAYTKTTVGKKKMDETIQTYREAGIGKTCGGSKIFTEDMMHDIAIELIEELQRTARRLQMAKLLKPSVVKHFDSLEASIAELGDEGYVIYITFRDDLSRMSLLRPDGSRTGDGIDNIVSLFETGYAAGGAVYGYWESAGENTWSRSLRGSLGFMKSTITRFNIKYNGTGCHAELLWGK